MEVSQPSEPQTRRWIHDARCLDRRTSLCVVFFRREGLWVRPGRSRLPKSCEGLTCSKPLDFVRFLGRAWVSLGWVFGWFRLAYGLGWPLVGLGWLLFLFLFWLVYGWVSAGLGWAYGSGLGGLVVGFGLA